MADLAATAERLRHVRQACNEFFTLWALDQMMQEHHAYERIVVDVNCNADSAADSVESPITPEFYLLGGRNVNPRRGMTD